MASSTSPHLCLRWNNYQSNLTNVFDQLLQNETFVDVTLAADGHAIKAHKMVLSACSPYFQALFFDNPCQHPIVILKDTRWSELKAVVEYMYRGEISVAQEELNSLLRVAETLKIRGLSELNGDRDRELHRDKMSTEEDSTSHAGSPPILGAGLVSERAAGAPNALPASTCSSGGSTGAGGGVAPGLLSAASLNGRKTDSPSSSCPLSSTNTPWGNHLISSGGAGMDDTPTPSASPALRHKRRRYSLGEGSTPPGPGSPEGSSPPTTTLHANTSGAEDSGSLDGPLPLLGHAHPSPASSSSAPSSQGFGPVSAGAPLSSTPHVADELDIKPGIAELIREEERARMLEGTHPWLAASPSVLSDPLVQWKSKAPSWSKEQLQEAIQAIVTQRMRFTQASAHYGIPKGTLYDNILGKSKRMLVLDDVGLHPADEEAVLDFCCETSAMPYNRRTNKSLESVVAYVEKLKQDKEPHFRFSGLVGFRWWWAFCKKHNIVSLYYSKNRNNNSGSNNHGSHNNNNNNNNTSTSNRNNNNNNNNNNTQHQNHNKLSHSVLSGNNNSGHHLLHTELLKKQLALYNNNNERLAPDADKPQNLSNRHQVEDKPENLSLYANLMLPAHSLAPGHVVAHRAMAGNATSKRAAQLYPPSRSRQRKHSVEAPEEDSDLEPENLSLHKH